MKYLLLFFILMLIGCKTTYVHQKYPIIPLEKRPILSEKLDQEDLKKALKWGVKHETAIKLYNEWAEEQNLKAEEQMEK